MKFLHTCLRQTSTKFTLHKDMNLQINSKCTIWHFLYATQQNQAYMILSFHNQSTGCNFMMDGLYLCVHIVLDFCSNKTFHYNVNRKTWKNYISSQNQINPLAKIPVYLMTSYSFRLSYLVNVCFRVRNWAIYMIVSLANCLS